MRAAQIFKTLQQNCFIFANISVRDNEQAKFSSHISKTALFWGKVYLVIIGTVRIIKWHHQNSLIFAKIWAPHNRGSANFQMTSLNLGYFCENLNSWLQGQFKISSECTWIAFFSWTLLIVIIGPVRLVIIGGGQVFKWHHHVMYCIILSFVIGATPFVLKMHSYLWIFFFEGLARFIWRKRDCFCI